MLKRVGLKPLSKFGVVFAFVGVVVIVVVVVVLAFGPLADAIPPPRPAVGGMELSDVPAPNKGEEKLIGTLPGAKIEEGTDGVDGVVEGAGVSVAGVDSFWLKAFRRSNEISLGSKKIQTGCRSRSYR